VLVDYCIGAAGMAGRQLRCESLQAVRQIGRGDGMPTPVKRQHYSRFGSKPHPLRESGTSAVPEFVWVGLWEESYHTTQRAQVILENG